MLNQTYVIIWSTLVLPFNSHNRYIPDSHCRNHRYTLTMYNDDDNSDSHHHLIPLKSRKFVKKRIIILVFNLWSFLLSYYSFFNFFSITILVAMIVQCTRCSIFQNARMKTDLEQLQLIWIKKLRNRKFHLFCQHF